MNIDWKEFAFIGIPSVLVGGVTGWFARRSGAKWPVAGLAGAGAGAVTAHAILFIRRRFNMPDQLPDKTMEVLPSAQVPVVTPTADAALGKVAAREKAVETPKKVVSNVTPTNANEVGDNVFDINPDDGMDTGALGGEGSI